MLARPHNPFSAGYLLHLVQESDFLVLFWLTVRVLLAACLKKKTLDSNVQCSVGAADHRYTHTQRIATTCDNPPLIELIPIEVMDTADDLMDCET